MAKEKISQELVDAAHKLRSDGLTHALIAETLGIPEGSISKILSRDPSDYDFSSEWNRVCAPFRKAAVDCGRRYEYDDTHKKFRIVEF